MGRRAAAKQQTADWATAMAVVAINMLRARGLSDAEVLQRARQQRTTDTRFEDGQRATFGSVMVTSAQVRREMARLVATAA